jgi:hypothetical protein
MEVWINDSCCFNGAVQNCNLYFDMAQRNQLTIKFTHVSGSIEIEEIFYNNLSIGHFIYQGMFVKKGSDQLVQRTHIDTEGDWMYSFDQDLATQIIKANT